jgi:hypothetical protein
MVGASPRISLDLVGVDELHAVFFDENRTLGAGGACGRKSELLQASMHDFRFLVET